MLNKKNRLKKRREFSYIYKKRKVYFAKLISLYTAPTQNDFVKVGFTVNNKVGNSVVRHKVKRRLSEIVRKILPSLPIKNYVFVAKEGSGEVPFSELDLEVNNLIKKVKNEG